MLICFTKCKTKSIHLLKVKQIFYIIFLFYFVHNAMLHINFFWCLLLRYNSVFCEQLTKYCAKTALIYHNKTCQNFLLAVFFSWFLWECFVHNPQLIQIPLYWYADKSFTSFEAVISMTNYSIYLVKLNKNKQ